MPQKSFILGTRASALALWQAYHVKAHLEAHGHEVRLKEITTQGDRILDVPLAQIGDKALFTKELDVALLDESIDLAVHSLKDLPSKLPDGIIIGAVGAREEPWDAFVAHPSFEGGLEELPKGAVVGTSSLRRQAQLKAWRSDLEIVPVRGNVDTRLAKLDASPWHGLVLAVAGLIRLNFAGRIRERVNASIMLPAVGQGALGITCRASDDNTKQALNTALHHEPTSQAVFAERAFLRRLEGGCQVPIGAYGQIMGARLILDGFIGSLDGGEVFRERLEGDAADGEVLGISLAEELLDQGGREVLNRIKRSLDLK